MSGLKYTHAEHHGGLKELEKERMTREKELSGKTGGNLTMPDLATAGPVANL